MIGETYYKDQTCERERHRREAVLGGGGGGTGACSPGKFLKNCCNLVSFGSFSESKFLVQKALISTEKTQEFENDSSNGLVDKNRQWLEVRIRTPSLGG